MERNPFFDTVAPFYNERCQARDFRVRRDRFVELGRKALLTSNGPPLCLDLGCGPGAITTSLAEIGYRAIGVDASPVFVDLARSAAAKNPEIEGRCSFQCEDLTTFLESFPEQADFIMSSSVFEYLPDPRRAIQLVSARLKPDGIFAVSMPNRRSFYRRIEPLLQLRRPKELRYTTHWRNSMGTNELIEAAEDLDLCSISTSYFGPFRLNERPVLSSLTDHSFVGSLALIEFAKW